MHLVIVLTIQILEQLNGSLMRRDLRFALELHVVQLVDQLLLVQSAHDVTTRFGQLFGV